jgi:hypothetical protein
VICVFITLLWNLLDFHETYGIKFSFRGVCRKRELGFQNHVFKFEQLNQLSPFQSSFFWSDEIKIYSRVFCKISRFGDWLLKSSLSCHWESQFCRLKRSYSLWQWESKTNSLLLYLLGKGRAFYVFWVSLGKLVWKIHLLWSFEISWFSRYVWMMAVLHDFAFNNC